LHESAAPAHLHFRDTFKFVSIEFQSDESVGLTDRCNG
jgi:hypothetical protein